MTKTIDVFAPAKINLTLHVTGQRDDGYHLLDSLVVFADIGDRLSVTLSNSYSIEVSGPMAQGVPAGPDNLCLSAAKFAREPVHIVLEKHLPSAAGIGGGSSDAAAVLQAIETLTGTKPIGDPATLGADVLVCLRRLPTRMQGIGEVLDHVTMPKLHLVLVNPGVEVPTMAVFRALANKDNASMPDVPRHASPRTLCHWLRKQRNDLEAPAIILEPVIGDVLRSLSNTDGQLCCRMSGSGATCFALYDSAGRAKQAAKKVQTAHRDWWVRVGATIGSNAVGVS